MNRPDMEIDLPYVTARANKDGSTRFYFRRRGQPVARLPSDPASVEFAEAYQRLLNWVAPEVYAAEGSFAWLCDQYMNSPDFRSKKANTQNARRRVILSMMREPIAPGYPEKMGDERADRINRRHVMTLRDRKADAAHAANERLKVLSQIFKLALAKGWREDNPVRDVARLRVKPGGHDTATDEQIDAYFAYHTEGTAWLAMKMLVEWGVRVSDLRVLGRQHLKGGEIVFDTIKTGMRCELPVSQSVLSALPRNGSNMAFLVRDDGAMFASEKAMSARVVKWIRQAGIGGITGHSIRKWLATKKAEEGATEMQLMAWFGWRDSKEAKPYVSKANRRKLAAQIGPDRVTQVY